MSLNPFQNEALAGQRGQTGNYNMRRYRVVNGKLEKRWGGESTDGWVVTKAEAIEIWEASKLDTKSKVKNKTKNKTKAK